MNRTNKKERMSEKKKEEKLVLIVVFFTIFMSDNRLIYVGISSSINHCGFWMFYYTLSIACLDSLLFRQTY